jgi:hypothetical protein
VALLASRVGVERTTLYNWLTTDRKPQPMQLLVRTQVTGLPALGLAGDAEIPEERVLRRRDTLWDYVEWEMQRTHESMPNDECDASLGQVRAEREAALRGAPRRHAVHRHGLVSRIGGCGRGE